MTLEDKKRAVFKQYPIAKEFHFTSDATAFYNASDAKVYADTLDDKSVELVKRSDVLKASHQPSPKEKKRLAEVGNTSEVESDKAKVESNQVADSVDKDALFAKLEALGGKAPKNTGVEKLQAKIAGLEAEKGTE